MPVVGTVDLVSSSYTRETPLPLFLPGRSREALQPASCSFFHLSPTQQQQQQLDQRLQQNTTITPTSSVMAPLLLYQRPRGVYHHHHRRQPPPSQSPLRALAFSHSVFCLPHQAVHLHRVHNIDLFCRGVYYLRASLLLPTRKGPGGDAATKGDRDGGSGKGSNNGSNNAGAGGEGAAEQQVEAQGIPYMCLAQCEDTETTVAHRKVPPLKVGF